MHAEELYNPQNDNRFVRCRIEADGSVSLLQGHLESEEGRAVESN